MSIGFKISDSVQAKTVEQFAAGLEKVRRDGTPLTRQQQSWLCVLQSLRPAELIPASLNLNGPIRPQNNVDNVCLWIHKPLTEKAQKMLSGKPARLRSKAKICHGCRSPEVSVDRHSQPVDGVCHEH